MDLTITNTVNYCITVKLNFTQNLCMPKREKREGRREGEKERERYSVTSYLSMLSILYCILLSAATKPYENHLLNNCCVYCAIVNKFAVIICVILI